ncbi:unnamed protein product, partial [Ectocarpus sp. 12 AP-2014]
SWQIRAGRGEINLSTCMDDHCGRGGGRSEARKKKQKIRCRSRTEQAHRHPEKSSLALRKRFRQSSQLMNITHMCWITKTYRITHAFLPTSIYTTTFTVSTPVER